MQVPGVEAARVVNGIFCCRIRVVEAADNEIAVGISAQGGGALPGKNYRKCYSQS